MSLRLKLLAVVGCSFVLFALALAAAHLFLPGAPAFAALEAWTPGRAAFLLGLLLAGLLAVLAVMNNVLLGMLADPLDVIIDHIRKLRANSLLEPLRNVPGSEELHRLATELNLMVEKMRGELMDTFKAKLALHESEQKFGAIFFDSPTAVVFTDASWRLSEANRAARLLFGLPPEAPAKGFDLSGDPNIPRWLFDEAAAGRAASAELSYDFGLVRAAKLYPTSRQGVAVLEARASPLWLRPVRSGLPDAFVFVFNDITERVRAERRLKEAMRKAQEADRLKMSFLSAVSHEVRTPLTAISGFSELLAVEDFPASERLESLRIIRENALRLMDMMSNMMDIARMDSGEASSSPTPIVVGELLSALEISYARVLKANGKENIALAVCIPPGDAERPMAADGVRLRRVFENLLDNAVKFTKSGRIAFGYEQGAPGETVFFVSDTGTGIPLEKREAVFECFRQGDETLARRHEGVGLGLTYCKKAVELMGGRIWLEETPGGGATARFSLPDSARIAPPEAAPGSGGERPPPDSAAPPPACRV